MEPEKKSNGALVGSIIIIILLVIGGLYLWQKTSKERMPGPNVPNQMKDLKDITGSDDSESKIEVELNQIDLETLDSDL